MTDYGARLFPQHQALLAASAISREVADARGYVTVDVAQRLKEIGIAKAGRTVPGLLIPIWGVDGEIRTYQYRPDAPRLNGNGKPLKYETPVKSTLALDVPPGARDRLGDPLVDLWVTEGSRKADAAVSAGLCCVALLGVWGWRGSNGSGGTAALACWESVALKGRNVFVAFDSDVMTKPEVRKALDRFAAFLHSRGAHVRLVYLPAAPDGGKVGLDDYLTAGNTTIALQALARHPGERAVGEPSQEPIPEPEPVTLAEALATFRRWLHIADDGPVLAVAAAVAANNADGDPLWLLLVGPPSSGKTETLQAAAGLRYVHSAATVTESSLLSGTALRDRDRDATGGLLRQVGEYGILLFKDFTSVLSQNKDVASAALAALREIYDGSWDRPIGAGGGHKLRWRGKCGLVGGVTPSIDRYGQVVGALGDRYLLLRLPDVDPASMAHSALDQGSSQRTMRQELAVAMTGLVRSADAAKVGRDLDSGERGFLVALATFTARARTVVERNGYTREVEVLPQPEGTGRIVGALRRLYGGLEAIGCRREVAADVVRRVALDCVPKLRRTVIEVLLAAESYTVGLGGSRDPDELTTGAVARAVGVEWKTATRHLEDLRLIGLAEMDITDGASGEKPTYWHRASRWLRTNWPVGGLDEKYTHAGTSNSKRGTHSSPNDEQTADADTAHTPPRTSRPDPQRPGLPPVGVSPMESATSATSATPGDDGALWSDLESHGPIGDTGRCALCGKPSAFGVCADCEDQHDRREEGPE